MLRACPPVRNLARYAAHEEHTQGRRHREPEAQYRGAFQRDRDRVVHCAAFRRLEYKTQVFVNHEGDMFRTRLTHSIEVAQVARSVARALQLNEDLTEAVALAHDLGHTPFGHAGQHALNRSMQAFGGFEHNLQSLRVVDLLEEKYAEFPGLNLTFETREGILKHCSAAHARALGPIGARFLHGTQPSLEAQIANLADEIAYNSHDVDDGLRSGLLAISELCEVAAFREPYENVIDRWRDLPERRVIHEVIRRMMGRQVVDLIETSHRLIETANPRTIEDVRTAESPLAHFSHEARARHLALKRFLRQRLYHHFQVHRMAVKAQRIVTELFGSLLDDVRLLPETARQHVKTQQTQHGESGRARAVADYVAGMTDRFAIAEHTRLCGAGLLP